PAMPANMISRTTSTQSQESISSETDLALDLELSGALDQNDEMNGEPQQVSSIEGSHSHDDSSLQSISDPLSAPKNIVTRRRKRDDLTDEAESSRRSIRRTRGAD
ncbi:hypothetical protein, partial, partial [Parasitella parasitica]